MQSDSASSLPASDTFFASTLRYIQFQKHKGGILGDKYDAIKIWNPAWHKYVILLQEMQIWDFHG